MQKRTATLVVLATLIFSLVYLAHAQKSSVDTADWCFISRFASQRQLRCIY